MGLLEFCVISVKLDPVFAFLVGEFQMHPAAAKAIALYDVFCAPGSRARISVIEALPPRNLQLQEAVEKLRKGYQAARCAESGDAGLEDSSIAPPEPLPEKYFFDAVAARVWQGRELQSVAESFDPARTPQDNLPNGRLTDGQRLFVDKLWEPTLRPYLVSAGFRRIANIA